MTLDHFVKPLDQEESPRPFIKVEDKDCYSEKT